jgi:oxygen-independent coproporphyrinogen-3 oxidase
MVLEAQNRNFSPFDVGFGIYVHWPFCLSKCPYCDFNSHVRHQKVDAESFASALVTELKSFHRQTSDRTVTSLFFGGGTPSLMPPRCVEKVIDAASDLWGIAGDAEITLEANPTSIEAGNFTGYARAGVNRVSVGIQALNDRDLKALGRQHTVAEALAAFELATTTFERTSFDLIYARPNQSMVEWREELTMALNYQQGHMSLYQLTIEADTAFEKRYKAGKLVIPDDDHAAALYDITGELTEKAGLNTYEISNHASCGHQSRHNLLYWRYGEYAGVGAGAHSRMIDNGNRLASSNEKHPETWLSMVHKTGRGSVESEVLSSAEQASEFLLMGLRLAEGISLDRYQKFFNETIDLQRINDLVEQQLLVFLTAQNTIAATPKGMRVLNGVIEYLAR